MKKMDQKAILKATVILALSVLFVLGNSVPCLLYTSDAADDDYTV